MDYLLISETSTAGSNTISLISLRNICSGLSWKDLMDTAATVLFTVIMGLVALFSCLSNSLFVNAILRHRKFRSPTYVLICNLSLNDILMAGFLVPQILHDLFHQSEYYEGKYIYIIPQIGHVVGGTL